MSLETRIAKLEQATAAPDDRPFVGFVCSTADADGRPPGVYRVGGAVVLVTAGEHADGDPLPAEFLRLLQPQPKLIAGVNPWRT